MARILIIDDDIGIRKLITLKLEKEHHEVFWAGDGMEGLKRIKEVYPDLIILDIMMPGLSGYEVLQKVKEDESLVGIPVMMLTAKGQLEDKVKGFEEGAYDYLTKPFEPRELSVRVNALLRLMDLQKQLIKSERLVVVGQIALNVKREVGIPLSSIIEKGKTILSKDISPDMAKKIELLLKSSSRIQNIVEKLETLQDTPVRDYLTGVKMIDLS